MYLQTKGLVLRQVEYSESDTLLTVLTADQGKLTLKARGVRRNSSTLKGACQLFCYASFTASSFHSYYTVTEAEPIEMFHGLRQELEALSLAAWLCQAAEAVADADAPSGELLRLTLGALYALSRGARPQTLIKAAFELRLACLSGFLPDLSCCAVCGAPEPDGFDVTRGMLCCLSCRDDQRGICLPLPPPALAAMRYVTQADPERVFGFSLTGEGLDRLGQITETYLLTQLQRSFSALDFYKALQPLSETPDT